MRDTLFTWHGFREVSERKPCFQNAPRSVDNNMSDVRLINHIGFVDTFFADFSEVTKKEEVGFDQAMPSSLGRQLKPSLSPEKNRTPLSDIAKMERFPSFVVTDKNCDDSHLIETKTSSYLLINKKLQRMRKKNM